MERIAAAEILFLTVKAQRSQKVAKLWSMKL